MKNALIAGLFLLLLGSHARADVFNMGPGLTSLQTVYVGDAGNAPDPTTGEGEVDYNYSIGTYDVTASQYVEFLNATSQQNVDYGLWNDSMPTDCGVVSAGIQGPYGVEPGWENRPVTDIDLWSAYRFVNWLDNGQGDGDTETGSYTLDGFTGNGYIQRNSGAQWYIPSLNECYKAAFYKGRGINAGYWLYPTQSDTVPGNQLPDPGNSANYYIPGQPYTDPTYHTTPVGAFSNSPGPYGTFDQGGNVSQWTDTVAGSGGTSEAHYAMMGNSFSQPAGCMVSTSITSRQKPYFYYSQLGFRVAEAVPEPPSALALLSMLGIPAALLCLRYRLREGCPREQPKHNSAAMLVVALLCCTALFAPTASHAAPDFSISIINSATLTQWLPMYEFAASVVGRL
jgi:formylglycine-generating enzyme required for sulfatase activity